jgi:hypothetical protein
MLPVITPSTHGVTLLIGLPKHEPLLELVAQLALVGTVQVIVGGNRFDAHTLARIVRQHTVKLDETLNRIQSVRPFTCIQTVKLITEADPSSPVVVLDLLNTFYDESISEQESVRLLCLVVGRLRQLGEKTAVIITVRQPSTAHRAGLLRLVRGIADRVYIYEQPPQVMQRRLL